MLDFSKAFDMVSHRKLLDKLRSYGISGQTLQWLESFLCHRTMKVVVDGEHSTVKPVTSGVPQGTVLGPILFLCYINDLPECVHSQVRLFADDCLLYREIRKFKDHIVLQKDLESLEQWAASGAMSFNTNKCQVLSIGRNCVSRSSSYMYKLNDHILQHVDRCKYLSVYRQIFTGLITSIASPRKQVLR